MRVLYCHQYFSTPEGSAGTRSYEFASRLVGRGHSVVMVCASDQRGNTGLHGPFRWGRRSGVVEGIEVVEFNLPYANRLGMLHRALLFGLFAARATWLALTTRFDLVFSTSTPLTAGIPGIAARWFRGKPFVFEVRDLWPELPRAMGVVRNRVLLGAMSLLEWVSYRSATRLVALAPGIRNGILRRGVNAGRVALIPNGCDLGMFADGGGGWRPSEVGEGHFLAIYAGAHGLANGLDAILDAAIVLKQRADSRIKLVLVGDGKVKPHLVRRAQASGLSNVVFVSPTKKIRLAGLFASADIGLQVLANVPAFYDGTSPNKFFDYLAAGLPVVVNYPGWVGEMVERAGCGFTVSPDDPGALADALQRAAADPAGLEARGRMALALGRDEFDRARLADDFVDWLEGASRR